MEKLSLHKEDHNHQRDTAILNKIIESQWWINPDLNPEVGTVEPAPKYAGMLAYADGTNWNPGSGAGLYRWTGAAWVFIGDGGNAHTVDTFHASQTPEASKILVAGSDATMPIEPIWDETVSGSAVTSVTTNGTVTLDGDAHGGYIFEFYLKNATAGTVNYRLYINNDTTNTNYYYDYLESTPAPANDALIYPISQVGQKYLLNGIISLTPDGYVLTTGMGTDHSDHSVRSWTHIKVATVTNLTRIDIVCDTASGIDVDSRFRLWRRM